MLNMSSIIIAIISFFLGNICGYLLHDFLKKSFNMNDDASKKFLMIVVTLVWAMSMVVDIASASYDVPLAVHSLLGLIVGFFFYRPKNGEGK